MQALEGSMTTVDEGGGEASNGLLAGLVGYWGLDEAGGANNALDKHTNALTLTQINSPGSAAGLVYASARTFSGASQYLTRASQALLQGGDNEMVWAAWVMLTAKTNLYPIIAKYDFYTNAGREYMLDYYNVADRFRLLVNTGAGNLVCTANTFGSPSLNTWYWVMAWHDPTANKVYINVNNGTPDSIDFSAGLRAGNEAFAIGGLPDGTYYHTGRIGPAMIWKSAAGAGGMLTADKRTALYNAGAGLAYSAFTN